MKVKNHNELINFKRTKILATIGPASSDPAVLTELIQAGANGLRLNLSHGTHTEHQAVIKNARRISKTLDKPIALVADLQGPKIRVGMLPTEGVALTAGQSVAFRFGDDYEPGGPLPVQHDISKYVKAGQPMSLRDGMIEVEITKVADGIVHTRVATPGIILSKQGINLPETDLGGDILTPKDLDDLAWAAQVDVDFVALSFVQSAADIGQLRARMLKLGSDAGIIAKIETRAAAEDLPAIVEAADAVMVARGDLAIEAGAEQVPILQQRIIELARRQQKIAIVATQMLESMINAPTPTRAEVSDVATAVTQGFDSVMLSGESAVGKYPVRTVAMMKRIIIFTEQNRPSFTAPADFRSHAKSTPIAAAAITLAEQVGARIIVAETSTGRTSRNLCSFRPGMIVVAVTHRPRTYQQQALVWGARSYLIKNPKSAGAEIMRMLKAAHNVEPGDVFVRASGRKAGVPGGTDTIQIEVVR
jgi:pyruvate kinase